MGGGYGLAKLPPPEGGSAGASMRSGGSAGLAGGIGSRDFRRPPASGCSGSATVHEMDVLA
jgi:hypothetical protein